MSNKPYGTKNQQDMAISFLNTGKTKEDFLKRHPNGINAWNWAKEKHEYLQTIPKIKEPKPFTIADYDSLHGDWVSNYRPELDIMIRQYGEDLNLRGHQKIMGPRGSRLVSDEDYKLYNEGKLTKEQLWMHYNYNVPYESENKPKKYFDGGKVNIKEGLIEGAMIGGLGNLGRDDNLLAYLMEKMQVPKALDAVNKLIKENNLKNKLRSLI